MKYRKILHEEEIEHIHNILHTSNKQIYLHNTIVYHINYPQ